MSLCNVSKAERRLIIGALQPEPGWETLNSQPLSGINHVCDARDLSRFADGTFSELYASHVLEHFDYKDEVGDVLREWFRVLAPGGRLFVSVPDMDTICRLYCDRKRFDAQDRFMFMRFLLGGHVDIYDYHRTAFNEESLVYFLSASGFNNIRRVADFCLFDDTSSLCLKGELISLNLCAEKPKPATRSEKSSIDSRKGGLTTTKTDENIRHVSFSITRNGTTYPFEYFFDTGQPTQRNLAAHILGGTLYEPEVSLVLMHILQSGDGFVDVGANVGFFTVIAARLVGTGGQVHAFEPETANMQRLRQNIALNELTNVELHEAAVGDHNGETELFINSDNDGGHALWNPAAHSFNKRSRETVIVQKTRLVTLDSALGNYAGAHPRIKAIKLDAEGYEQHVLIGAVETIRHHNIPFVLAEINRFALLQAGADERSFRKEMQLLGYAAYQVEIGEGGKSVHFLEMPPSFFPSAGNPETVYNIVFCLPGEPERYGFQVTRAGR